MPLPPLTIGFFLYAILFAVMGWEIGAAVAGGLGVLNHALVEYAISKQPPPPPPGTRVDDGEPTLPPGFEDDDDGVG